MNFELQLSQRNSKMVPSDPSLVVTFVVAFALQSTASQIILLFVSGDRLDKLSIVHGAFSPMDLRIRLTAGLQIYCQVKPDHFSSILSFD